MWVWLQEEVKALVVSIVSSEREGMREFQESVRSLVTKIGEIVEEDLVEKVELATAENKAKCKMIEDIDKRLEDLVRL